MPLKITPIREETKIDNNNILSSLNDKQKEAVLHKNGPLLIIAGAGSGKTKVLTHRIANLIQSGVKPWNILALTFTNKAAKELKTRLANLLSDQVSESIWTGTFHSIFARILRIEAEVLEYTSNFSVYDADDQLAAIKRVMNREGISISTFQPQRVRSIISNAKSNFKNPSQFDEEADTPFFKQVAFIYGEYEKYLKQSNAMDFDDLLLNMIRLLKSSKEILEKYQDKFRFILVDEYQDTNKAQYIAINLMAKKYSNICVVGDDAQSIYRWRGADIRNILDFKKDFPQAKTVRLEQNYRSSKNILALADSLIKNNKNQLEKNLWTDNHDGDKIEVLAGDDENFEADLIAQKIKSLLEGDYEASDIAILYRTNAQSLALENSFKKHRLSYIIVGGTSFFKRKEIKDALAYLRLLVNKNDNEAFLRIINEPPRGLGKTSLEYLIEESNQKNISFYEGALNSSSNRNLQDRAKNAFLGFVNIIEKYSTEIENQVSSSSIINFIEQTGLLEMYSSIGTEEANDRWNNIQQLISDISSFLRDNNESTLDDYLQQVALITDADKLEDKSDLITLMTLHTSKGLEYPIIFISGMEDGLFPMQRATEDRDEKEEERRLLYVGITRAMEKLYLSYAKRRMRFGETKFQNPSIFLHELNKDLLIWSSYPSKSTNKLQSSNFNNYASSNTKKKEYNEFDQTQDYNISQTELMVNDFKVGDIVFHSKFGRGKISGLKGFAEKRQATIRFDEIGKKDLMLKFAKLKKL